MMKRVFALVLAAGFVVGSYATDARVAVMGRQATPWFYRDEVSVFTNPADMSLYPNMIYGSFGVMPDQASTNFNYENIYPVDPFFGAMFSYRFSEEDNGPMFSIGAFANRRDPTLARLLSLDPNLADPLGKIDLLFGYDMGNGVAVGLGLYAATQYEKVDSETQQDVNVFKGSLGLNWNIEQGLDLEVAVNAGSTTGKYRAVPGGELEVISNGEYFLRGDVRFFSAVTAINGSFVPQVSLEFLKLNKKDVIDLNGGVGVNVNIDRGFFWAGLQGVYEQETGSGNDYQSIGGRLSFGIERNIVWDWFLIRVGGQKELRYITEGSSGNTSRWWENESHDGTDGDLVGLGFGINIDNRLRVDFVASENIPYTFTNLFSGGSNNLFNRVSATYRF